MSMAREHGRMPQLHGYENLPLRPMRKSGQAHPPRASHRWLKHLSVLFALVMAGLLVWVASKVDWPEVWSAIKRIPLTTLLLATAVAAASHAVYASYDLLGKRWTGHRLSRSKVLQATFVCYAFNLSLGSLVGGVALRYRLYSRLGLGRGQISRVLAMSLVSNWLGYAVLAGGVFLMGWLRPPPDWSINLSALRVLGAAMWAAVAAYIAYCTFARRRRFMVRGHVINLPSGKLALLQLLPSTLNWLLMAVTLWVLLQDAVPFPHIMGALLAGAIAGVVTHMPAGVGVLEAVVIALTPGVPAHALLAGLLAYRAIYYLLPLALAAVWYAVLESKGARHLDRVE